MSLILLQRGDTIVFRTDIPHAGAENLTDNPNYRLHAFWHIPNWKGGDEEGFTAKKVKHNQVEPYIKWNKKENKFNLFE